MSFFDDNPFSSFVYMNGINMNKDRQDEYFRHKVLESLSNKDKGKCNHRKRYKSPGDEEDYGTDSASDSDCNTDLSSGTRGQGPVSQKAKSKKKRTSVKQGTPDDDELEELGSDIGAAWRKLGPRLRVAEAEITALHKENEDLAEKGYKMLLHWKQSNAEGGTRGQGPVSQKAKSKKRTSVKQGTPDDDELEELGSDIGAAWRKLGRRLRVAEVEITAIHKENEELAEKGYKMLLHWKQSNAEGASYQVLYDALNHKLVARSDLAQKYCVK